MNRDDLHFEIIRTLQKNDVVCNGPVIIAVDKLVDQLIPRVVQRAVVNDISRDMAAVGSEGQ